MDETEVLKAEAELEKLQNKLIKLQNTKTKINIDSNFDPNDTSGMKINGQDFEVKEITGYSTEVQKLTGNIKQLHTEEESLNNIQINKTPITNMSDEVEKTKTKINGFRGTVESSLNGIDTSTFKVKLQSAIEAVKAKLQELKNGNNDFNFTGSEKQLELLKYKISEIQEKLEQAKNGEIHMNTGEIVQAEAELEKLNNQKAKLGQGGNTSFFTSLVSKIKNAGSSLKQNIKSTSSWKNGFNQINKVSTSVKNKIKQMGSGMKSGLKDVLKYDGALFSLRSIYSTLSSSASSWLSSQNAGAQQLSANIDYMKYAMGSAFAPVIEYVTNLGYKLMKAIQSVAYALTGVNIFANASASAYSSMADSASDAAKETKQLAGFDEINNLTDSDSSSSSGRGSTSPSIDLSSVDTSSSIADLIASGDWSAVGEALAGKINEALAGIDWTEIQSTTKTIATNIGEFINGFVSGLDWDLLGSTVGEGINTALIFADTLLTTIDFTKIGSSLATGLNSTISTTNWALMGKTFADGINMIIDTAYGFVTKFDWSNFGTSIGDGVNSFFSNIKWGEAGTTLSESIKGVFDTKTSFLQTFDWSTILDGLWDFFSNIDWSGVADSIFTALGSAIASVLNLGMLIGEKINEGIDSAKTYFQDKIEECGGNVVEGIFTGIKDAISSIGTWINEHIFQPFMNGFKSVFGINSPSTVMAEMGGYLIDGLKNGLKNIWTKIEEIFTTLKTNISTKFSETLTKVKEKFSVSAIKTHFSNVVSNIKSKFTSIPTWFKDKFGTVWANIKNKFNLSTIKTYFGNVLTGIKNKFSNIPTWFKDKFSSAWEKVKKVFSSGGKVFDGIKDGILNGFKTVINKLISGINKVIKVPFDGINKALDKIKNVEIVGKKPFGSLPTISIPQIPTLATGNIATEETLAIFGEYSNARTNPEITAPQSTIYETMVQALDDSKFASNNNGSGLGTLVVKFGSYRVAYEIEDLIKKAHRANGTATVTV